MRKLALSSFLLILCACSALGVPTPNTFNQRLATGYSTVTAVRTSAQTLLESHILAVADAVQVQQQADNFRAGLDIARTVHETAPGAAEDKLASILTGLQGLQAYLTKRKAGGAP